MNDIQTKLLEQASGILSAISNAVAKGYDLATQEIPEIAIEYVTWGRATATVTELILLLAFLTGMWLLIRVGCLNSRCIKDSYGSWGFARQAAIFVGALIAMCSGIQLLMATQNFLMVWVAPKVWLIREIIHLAK